MQQNPNRMSADVAQRCCDAVTVAPRPTRLFATVIGFFAVWLPLQAHAWGDEGHQIIAMIAEQYLQPSVRQRVESLLATDDSGLLSTASIASEAMWADRYRDSDRRAGRERYEHTYRWHFVDLDLHRPDLAGACFGRPSLAAGIAASAGPARDCIVDKIDQFETELASPATAQRERRIALQFLLHLVGDLHQPLHASTDDDQGGNRKRVLVEGAAGTSLHAYWDVDLVQRLGPDARAIANDLGARISPALVARWSRGSASDWAFESWSIARSVAYGGLPASRRREPYHLSDRYVVTATQAVRLQLERAGVRLAALLNRALQ
jgi:hypothetical protein